MASTSIIVYSESAFGNDPGAREGKFVQLSWRRQEHLVFATPETHCYHNQILAHFAADQHIQHHWRNVEHLEIDHPELQVAGGGRFRLLWESRKLSVWDNSQAYGRFDPVRLRTSLRAAAPPWSELQLEIG